MIEASEKSVSVEKRTVGEILSGASLNGEGGLTRCIYRLLRTLIIQLQLPPNQFLSEKEVAGVLNVSKTPVREAFIRLSEDGLVNIVPQSGTYVSPIDIKRACEGYFIRSSLESSCAERVAESRSLEDIGTLKSILAEQRDALAREDYPAFLDFDNKFHDALFAIADLPNTKQFMESVKYEVDRIRNLKLKYRIRNVEKVFAEHTAVVDAVIAKDADRARRTMLVHLGGVNDTFESLAKSEEFWDLFHNLHQGRRGKGRAAAKS